MKPLLAALALAAGLGVLPAQAQPSSVQPPPAAASSPNSVESVRQAMRSDKRGLVERNMHLTPAEAAKFWPLYDDYQAELDRIVQRQNRAVLDYINGENTMTDANAKRILREVMRADADEQRLREKQLRNLLAVLPARKAVRYMQIENKLRTIQRYDVAERLSLVR
jgi:succinate dehydrogenase flavin-adding protein (antitoxin of CptAB toxin-antitoxin module)